jgi:carbon monoxide dehydrogenase subunit G
MELSNTRIVPIPRAAVWAALNDPAVLKDCLPGCELIEPAGEHAWRVVMAARVGPVSARFSGRMTMTDIEEPEAYTLQFDGQGGAAGFARGEARVTLKPQDGEHTAMSYVAKAQVGGKLAQIGSRLVDGAAAKLADDFFARCVTRASDKAPTTASMGSPDGAGALEGTAAANAPVASSSTEGSAAGMAPRSVPHDDSTSLAPAGGAPWIRYAAIIAIVVVLILLYTRGYR